MASDMCIRFGPAIPVVPVTHFSKHKITEQQWAEVWSVCGPSVERNMAGPRPMELWKVIAAAYIEGLHHGASLARDETTS